MAIILKIRKFQIRCLYCTLDFIYFKFFCVVYRVLKNKKERGKENNWYQRRCLGCTSFLASGSGYPGFHSPSVFQNRVACFQEVGEYWWLASQWKTSSTVQKKPKQRNKKNQTSLKLQNLSLGTNLIFLRLCSFHSGKWKSKNQWSYHLKLAFVKDTSRNDVSYSWQHFFGIVLFFLLSYLHIFTWILITKGKSNTLIVVYSFVLKVPCRNEKNFIFTCKHTRFLVSFFLFLLKRGQFWWGDFLLFMHSECRKWLREFRNNF